MQQTGDTSREPWRLGHRPALDGLRGVAVLLVLASHLRLPGSGMSGAVGVVVFFALSGFLITSLLLQKRPRMSDFYARRARRLLPALGACLLLTLGLQMTVDGRVHDWPLMVGALTYGSDWVQAAGAYTQTSALGHLWSLAVEEQFYILWPILLVALQCLPRRWIVFAISTGIILSWYVRALYYADHSWVFAYHMPEGRVDELLVGCLVAVALHGRRAPRLPGWVAAPALAGIGALCLSGTVFGLLVMPTLAAALSAVAIVAAVGDRQPALLAHPALTWFGRRSYGLYLYHLPLRWAFDQTGAGGWVAMVTVLALSLLLAELSWRFVESPILSRRRGDARQGSNVGGRCRLEVGVHTSNSSAFFPGLSELPPTP